jgi:hypothetical protein
MISRPMRRAVYAAHDKSETVPDAADTDTDSKSGAANRDVGRLLKECGISHASYP